MTSKHTLPVEFEPEFLQGLKSIFEEKIVFNQVLGLKITDLKPTHVKGRIEMRPELIGHYSHNRIHGGVISASLDAMGGLACMAAIGARHMDESPAKRLERFAKLGTIDLRIDYLRPGIGAFFRTHRRGDAAGLARGLHAHGISRAGWQIDVHRRRCLHRVMR